MMVTTAFLLWWLLLLFCRHLGSIGCRGLGRCLGRTGLLAGPSSISAAVIREREAVLLSASKLSPPVTILKLSSGRRRERKEYRLRVLGITGTGGT